jgi:dTDP-4-dehydrorhamnose 3,5-epimerase
MKIAPTAIPGLLIFTPTIYSDSRGSFFQTYHEKIMGDAGLPTSWKQDNFSISHKNVVRGLHYQVVRPQGKLVRVAYGRVIDVAVDLRRSSPSFGQHIAVELSAEKGAMLWMPPGFGHGFAVLSETAGFAYKVSDYYSPEGERTILWNDPDLSIAWPVPPEEAVISEKDAQGSRFRDAEVFP